MTSIPSQLINKAKVCGLACLSSEQGEHCIQPIADSADWQLTYRKGRWVLMVKSTPQICFTYEEALKFLDRVSKGIP